MADVPALMDACPVTVSENELVIVIAAAPLFDGSATLIALMDTLGGAVRTCGAVYVPAGSIAPHAAPAQPPPDTIQLTARSGLPVELTMAANGRAAPNSTGIVCGDTETEMSLVTVIRAVALLELSAALVACTLTDPVAGRSTGEVYTPLVLIVPTAGLPPEIPFTLQFTAAFSELLTVAVNACGSPSSTEAEGGETLTLIPDGGGGGEAGPTTPPQPRRDMAKKMAARQRIETLFKLRRPPCAVSASMRHRIARALPAGSIHRNTPREERTTHGRVTRRTR